MVPLDDKRRSLVDALVSLLIVGVSLYPLYRDDLARYRLWIKTRLTPPDSEAEAMKQVQREISLLEHGAE